MQRVVVGTVLVAGLGLASCSRPLELPAAPEPPKAPVTEVARFEPSHGYAGTPITIEGREFGSDPSAVEVRFGTSRRVAPRQVAKDGTSLVVLVPDDATNGPVTVDGPAGVGTSSEAFTFDGLGRLRAGLVTATADLRPELTEAFVAGGDRVLLDRNAWWAGRQSILSGVFETIASDADALAPAANDAFYVLRRGNGVACPLTRRGGVLELHEAGNVTAFCLSKAGEDPPEELDSYAIVPDPGGKRAVVFSGKVWLVDTTKAPEEAVRGTSIPLDARVAWLSDAQLAVLRDDTIQRFSFENAENEGDPATLGGTADVVAVAPGRLLANAHGYEVRLYSLDAWPPAALSQFDAVNGDVVALAFSDDARRLAVAKTWEDGVMLYDLANPAEPKPLANVPVEEPKSVHAQAGGTFVAATRGAVLVLSAQTGAELGRTRIESGLGLPLVRRTGEDGTRMVELFRHNMNHLVRRRFADLGDAFSFVALHEDGEVTEIAAARDGRKLFTAHGKTIRRLDETTEEREADDACTLPASVHLRVSPDERVLIARYDGGSTFHTQWKVALFDATKPLEGTSPPIIDVGGDLFSPPLLEADPDGHLYVATDDEVRVVDLGLGRGLAPADVAHWKPAGPPLAIDAVAGRLFLTVGSESLFSPHPPWLEVGTPDGRHTVGPALAGALVHDGDLHVTTNGRRLFSLRSYGDRARLVSLALDPETGVTVEDVPAVELPPTAVDMLAMPDGSAVVVSDPVEDRLYLIE